MRTMPLSRWLLEQQRQGAHVDDALRQLLETVGRACQRIAYAVRQGPLAGLIGEVGNQNVQGEAQKILDVIANDTLLEVGGWTGTLCGMASEEMELPHDVPDHSPKGGYLLLFDPLDGSSNIDVNVSIGTIFSVLHAPEHAQSRTTDSDDYLQPGRQQVAAGYAVYGPSALLVLTLGNGVAQFILDSATGDWILTADKMQIPADTQEYSINTSNARHWEEPVKRYFDELQTGRSGPLGKNFNMRWVGSMVADVHRIMTRGGIFMYPKDAREPGKAGKLRLMYEANPMAMLIEQAGGAATNGHTRILDIAPEELHQRCAVFLGSRNEVARVTGYHTSPP